MTKSDAQKTLESSIISGISKNAHITGASIEYIDIQVRDLMEQIFHPSTVWAVIMYLEEIGKLDKIKE